MTQNDISIAKFLMIKKAEGFTIKPFEAEGKKKYHVVQYPNSAFEQAYEKTLDGDWIKGFTPDDLGGLSSEDACGGCGGCKGGPKQPWEQDGDWWKKTK